MKTIAIIGGTGMLGAPVAKQLLKDGFNVRVVSRNPSKAAKELGDAFDYRAADIRNVANLKSALIGSDWIHINLSGHDKQSYYEAHVTGTRNVLKALEGSEIEGISMISSASAYPEFNDRWDNRYKLEGEELLKQSGRNYLAFLPSWFMETLDLFQQKKRMMQIGPSTRPIHWITASDYAKVVSDSLKNPSTRNQRISVYGPEAMTLRDAFAVTAKARGISVQTLPAWAAKWIGRLTRDPVLVDVADLTVHYDRTGEKTVPNTVRTETTLAQWLSKHPATIELSEVVQ